MKPTENVELPDSLYQPVLKMYCSVRISHSSFNNDAGHTETFSTKFCVFLLQSAFIFNFIVCHGIPFISFK